MEAAFFDLDKTVIARASIAAFGRPFHRGGLISRRTVVRALASQLVYLHLGAGEKRMGRTREAMLELTRGWDSERVTQIVRETLLETVEPIIYQEALALMEEHRKAGRRVYIVSAAPEEIVQPLAELLGADGAVASRAEIDPQGRYTGMLAFYASGPSKAEAIAALAQTHQIHLAESFAYSDSITDLPMLEAVGHPVVVNPDRALARLAAERGWEVRQFTQPVRLRNRGPGTRPIVTTGIALVGAAVLIWRHGHRLRAAGLAA